MTDGFSNMESLRRRQGNFSGEKGKSSLNTMVLRKKIEVQLDKVSIASS